jgi:bifunctional non-homologous end joining protein LigD
MPRSLARYREMRDFGVTPEPSGTNGASPSASEGGVFVVQRHEASRLHYDFRLELDGTLVSWAVPREPSMSIGVRRLAVRTEDHPREYAEFHGDIPEGQYGAGRVQIWDRGTWRPVGDAQEGLTRGHLKFELAGERLRGRFVMIRMKSRGDERQENWLLIRERDVQPAAQPVIRTRASRRRSS